MAQHPGRQSPAYGHTLASSAPIWSFNDFTAYADNLLRPVRYELDWRAKSPPSQTAEISRRLRDLTNWQTALCGARGGRTWEAVMEESGIEPYHVQVNLDHIVQVLQALPLEAEAAPMLPNAREVFTGDLRRIKPYISRYLSPISPPSAPVPSAFHPVGRATLGSHQQHQASSTHFTSRHPSDAATWIKTIHDGIDGALRVWSVELQAAQRSNHTEAVSLIVARCEEIRDWQERVAPNLARVWGRPSAERITQRFVNAHALLENLTGWPLRETFVLPDQHTLLDGVVEPWMIVNTGHVDAFYRQLQQTIKHDKLASDKTAAGVAKDRNWFRLVHIRLHMVTQWLVYIHSNGSRATLLKLSGSELDRLTAEIIRVAQGLQEVPVLEPTEPLPTLQQLFARLQLCPSVTPP